MCQVFAVKIRMIDVIPVKISFEKYSSICLILRHLINMC